jgi:hypothetical protein
MKHSARAIASAMVVMCLFTVISCTKNVEDKAAKHCDIIQMKAPSYFEASDSNTYVFEYNQHGDPVKITPSIIGTGRPYHVFRYDKKHRLSDYIGRYENVAFEFWHRYGYDNKNRIVKDTFYIFGFYDEGPTSDLAPGRRIFTYEYDVKNRIIKTSIEFVFNPSYNSVELHTYDNNGNLIRPGYTYDNKVNYHRTHPVWMFLDADYSENNAVLAVNYNDGGLPTFFNPPDYTETFLHYIPVTHIWYDCKGKKFD